MTRTQKLCLAGLVGLLGVWATSALGFWQLRRAADKEALQSRIDEAARSAPVALDREALRMPVGLVNRHVILQGRWRPEAVVYLDNRPHAGTAGFYVLMPLRIEGVAGVDVIVNRGWTPRNMDDRTRIGAYRTPDGPIEVTGVVEADEQRFLDLGPRPDRFLKGIWQNFDFDAYARASGTRPLPIVVRADAGPSSTDDGLLRDWPDRGGVLQSQIDRHHGYAFQWFALAATLAVLLAYQSLRLIRHGRTVPQPQ